jgi:2-isopropylmalate synthase
MDRATSPGRLIHFSDTTLRDGEQMPGAALNPSEKLRIAHALAEAGVSSIDAGFPACSADEVEAIRNIAAALPATSVSALCRTLRSDIDLAWEALSDARRDKRSVSLFVGTSPVHREHKLRRSVTEILKLTRESVEYARRRFDIVAFSPEDASRTEPDVLCTVYAEAIDAGARVIGFPDTVGVLRPAQVRDCIRYIQDGVANFSRAMLAVHFHNDLGLAAANTLSALEEGVSIVQCTVNGIGERAGNAALEEIAMIVALHGPALGLRSNIALDRLWSLSRLVSELTGIPASPNKAVVGSNIFATSAGIHQDGLLKNPDTYLPFVPERVGAPGIELVPGKHSGRAAFAERLSELALDCRDEVHLSRVVAFAKAASKHSWKDPDALLREAFHSTLDASAAAANSRDGGQRN